MFAATAADDSRRNVSWATAADDSKRNVSWLGPRFRRFLLIFSFHFFIFCFFLSVPRATLESPGAAVSK